MIEGKTIKPSWDEFKEYATGGVIQKNKEPIDISHTDYCYISVGGNKKKDGA